MDSRRLYRRIDSDTGLERHLGITEQFGQTYMVQIEETEDGAEIEYAEADTDIYNVDSDTRRGLDMGFESENSYGLNEFNGFEQGVESLADKLEPEEQLEEPEAIVH